MSVHSKNALFKLSQLQIGEIVSSEQDRRMSYSSVDTASALRDAFDPYEYRRYALTLITPIADGAGYKVRFCLLYPHQAKQSPAILPGQCVEISTGLAAENFSRYYSPFGSMTALEIIVKNVPGGRMSTYLSSQRIAERQFKIRGPFGQPIVDPQRPLHSATRDTLPANVIFLAAGSGITPFLQLLRYSLLPTRVNLMVKFPHFRYAQSIPVDRQMNSALTWVRS
jgi:Oxidoreductase FAD-binding domain